MLRWIIGSSLKFRFIVVGFAVGLMVIGVAQLRNAPVDFSRSSRRPEWRCKRLRWAYRPAKSNHW